MEAYQWSITPPTLAADGAKWGVAPDFDAQAVTRGKAVFEGQAKCSGCHGGPSITDVDTFGLHLPGASVALDKRYINFSATKQWRSTPAQGRLDASAVFSRRLRCLQSRDRQVHGWIGHRQPGWRKGPGETGFACVVNRYSAELSLGLTDPQRVDLVEYLKSR